MNNPLVSIIIPVYNLECHIGRCLDSVCNQSLRQIEVILVDDCSTDNSMSVVKKYSASDHRVKLISFDSNQGPMIARQSGYLNAKGDYITFCDGDDVLPVQAIEVLYQNAISSKADIVCANMTFISTTGNKRIMPNVLKYGTDSHSVYKSLLKGELVHSLCAKLFTRDILQGYHYVNYPHFTNGEDGLLFYQIVANAKKIIQIDESVYYYMQNVTSSSQKVFSELAVQNIVIANKNKELICGNYPDLRNLLFITISKSLNSYIDKGYGTYVKKHLKEQDMLDYISLTSMFSHYPLFDFVKTLIRRLFHSILK